MFQHELNVKLPDTIIHSASSFRGPTCGNCLVAAFTSLKLQASVLDQFWEVPIFFNHYLGQIITEYLLVIEFCLLILGLLFFIISFCLFVSLFFGVYRGGVMVFFSLRIFFVLLVVLGLFFMDFCWFVLGFLSCLCLPGIVHEQNYLGTNLVDWLWSTNKLEQYFFCLRWIGFAM